jgi:hypothetical protein
MCCGDSDLVAQQVAGTFKARNEDMVAYRDEVDEMAKSFLGYDIKCRGDNYQGRPRAEPSAGDILGISTVFSQKGRLHLKGRLRQQLAGDFTEESWNSSNSHFAKSGLAPTRSTHTGDKRDASHAWPRPISEQDPPPRKDPRQSRGDMPRRCWSEGKRHFIKLPMAGEEPEDGRAMPRPRPRRSRQPGNWPPNLKPDPRLYKGV